MDNCRLLRSLVVRHLQVLSVLYASSTLAGFAPLTAA